MRKETVEREMIQYKLQLPGKKFVRSVWDAESRKWFFSLIDLVSVLSDTKDPSDYLKKVRKRERELNKSWKQIVVSLPFHTNGGRQPLLCADTRGALRVIQAMPSQKADTFKRWMARVASNAIGTINAKRASSKLMEISDDPQLAKITETISKIMSDLAANEK